MGTNCCRVPLLSLKGGGRRKDSGWPFLIHEEEDNIGGGRNAPTTTPTDVSSNAPSSSPAPPLPLSAKTPPTPGLLGASMQAEWDRGEEKRKNNVDQKNNGPPLLFDAQNDNNATGVVRGVGPMAVGGWGRLSPMCAMNKTRTRTIKGGATTTTTAVPPLPPHNNDNDDDKDERLATDVHDLSLGSNTGLRWSASATWAHSNQGGYAKGVGLSRCWSRKDDNNNDDTGAI